MKHPTNGWTDIRQATECGIWTLDEMTQWALDAFEASPLLVQVVEGALQELPPPKPPALPPKE